MTSSKAASDWAQIAALAPQIADTLGRYLSQAATFLAPNSVEVADRTLRQLAGWLLEHSDIRAVADIGRSDIEDFKVWLVAQPGMRGEGLTANTQRQRLRMLRVFFERIIEWDWPDAPARNPVIGRDIPPRPEPLPKFLDDRDAARLMAAARAATDPRDRLVVEVLARTGLRAGELCGLDADAVVLIGDNHWLRVPVGKLRNDRYVPLHPDLVTLFADWTAANVDHIRLTLENSSWRRMPFPSGASDRHLANRARRTKGRWQAVAPRRSKLGGTMPDIREGRWTAEIDGDFVVFLIGARINSKLQALRAFKDLGGSKGMRAMLDYLTEHPEKGLLGYETAGFTVIQYWRSFEHLEAFAKDKEDPHLEAWRNYWKRVGKSGRTGIWHETFLVRAGEYEAIYGNMPPRGLGKASKLVPLAEAVGARQRLVATLG